MSNTHDEKIQILRALAAEAEAFRIEKSWSIIGLVKNFAGLGSTKTYGRILDENDPLAFGIDVGAQLEKYQGAIELIRHKRAQSRAPEPEYDDFRHIVTVKHAVATALDEEQISRLVLIEGENGTGKDSCYRACQKSWPNTVFYVEANPLWTDTAGRPSVNEMLREVLEALNLIQRPDGTRPGGEVKTPRHGSERLPKILEALNERKIVLWINEGHHLGPEGLNMIKTLINRSPVVPVLACVPALLGRLSKKAFEESRQLFGNRLSARITLEGAYPDEIQMLHERRKVKFADAETSNLAARRISEESPKYGNWRFVNNTCRKMLEIGEGGQKPITMEMFAKGFHNSLGRGVQLDGKTK